MSISSAQKFDACVAGVWKCFLLLASNQHYKSKAQLSYPKKEDHRSLICAHLANAKKLPMCPSFERNHVLVQANFYWTQIWQHVVWPTKVQVFFRRHNCLTQLKAPALRSPALAFEAREFAAATTSTVRALSIPVFTLASSINESLHDGENIPDSKVRTSSLLSKLLSAVADLQFCKESYNIWVYAEHYQTLKKKSGSHHPESRALILCLLLNKVPLDFILPDIPQSCQWNGKESRAPLVTCIAFSLQCQVRTALGKTLYLHAQLLSCRRWTSPTMVFFNSCSCPW